MYLHYKFNIPVDTTNKSPVKLLHQHYRGLENFYRRLKKNKGKSNSWDLANIQDLYAPIAINVRLMSANNPAFASKLLGNENMVTA